MCGSSVVASMCPRLDVHHAVCFLSALLPTLMCKLVCPSSQRTVQFYLVTVYCNVNCLLFSMSLWSTLAQTSIICPFVAINFRIPPCCPRAVSTNILAAIAHKLLRQSKALSPHFEGKIKLQCNEVRRRYTCQESVRWNALPSFSKHVEAM